MVLPRLFRNWQGWGMSSGGVLRVFCAALPTVFGHRHAEHPAKEVLRAVLALESAH